MHKKAIRALAVIALALPAISALAGEEDQADDYYLEQPEVGAINTQTGEYYPPAGTDGVIDADTGEYYPKAGPDGFIDPATGDYHPTIE